MAPFWANVLHWLDGGRQGVVGVAPNAPFNVLSESGMQCEKTDFREGLSVFVCTPYGDAHLEEIHQFVAEGGGLLIGGHAWYWAQCRPGVNELIDFPGMIAHRQSVILHFPAHPTPISRNTKINVHRGAIMYQALTHDVFHFIE